MLEGAYQFGENRIRAFSFPTMISPGSGIWRVSVSRASSRTFKDRLNNQLGLSYEVLTGDDPDTRDDETFDVLWGRWPHWAETAIYGWAAETRAGQLANLHRFGPFWTMNPLKNTDFSATYNALFAPEDTATRGAPGMFSNDGNFRGHFVQAALKHKFSRHVSGHLWSELLFPGDYYVHHSMASFLRAEVMVSF
jgi:hypothetical protein